MMLKLFNFLWEIYYELSVNVLVKYFIMVMDGLLVLKV